MAQPGKHPFHAGPDIDAGIGDTGTRLPSLRVVELCDPGVGRIAGHLLDAEVLVGDELLTSAAGVVPPERRRVGMVFQDWALFPHLSVAANVGYGLSRAERRSGTVLSIASTQRAVKSASDCPRCMTSRWQSGSIPK